MQTELAVAVTQTAATGEARTAAAAATKAQHSASATKSVDKARTPATTAGPASSVTQTNSTGSAPIAKAKLATPVTKAVTTVVAASATPPAATKVAKSTSSKTPKGAGTTKADDSTARHGDISGGNIFDCLAASNLDGLCRLLLTKHYVKATVLYLVRTGQKAAAVVRDKIRERVAAVGWLLAPLHVRFHWTTAIFSVVNDVLSMHVLDSAPSPITRGDINDLANRLGIPLTGVVSPVTQPARSNECGLHVVQYALLAATRPINILTGYDSRERGREISLAPWRKLLADMQDSGISQANVAHLLAAVKDHAFKTEGEKSAQEDVPASTHAAEKATTASTRRNDPYAANVFRGLPPPYGAAHLFDVAGGGTPEGLPNPPGENVCAFNALCQALDCHHRARHLINVGRAAGLNKVQGPRRIQEDVSEIAGRCAPALALSNDIVIKYVKTWSQCRHSSTRYETASLVPTTDSVAASYVSEEELPCSQCQVLSKARIETVIESASARLVFTFNRARHDASRTGAVSRARFQCPKVLNVGGNNYTITGLVYHRGASVHGGHYFAYRKIGPQWYCFDDMSVTLNEPAQSATEALGVVAVYDAVPVGARGVASLRSRRAPSARLDADAAHSSTVPPAEAPVEPLPGRPRGARAKKKNAAPPATSAVTDAAYMSHGAIRRLLSGAKPADVLRVHFNYMGDAGIWEGSLAQQVPGSPASRVTYTQRLCADCGMWHNLEFPTELEFPYPSALYFSATLQASLQPVCPDCDPDRSELDDSAEACIDAPIRPEATAADPRDREALLGEDERELLSVRAPSSNVELKGSVGLRWNVYPDKPAHVHTIAWRKLAASTRTAHITWLYRIKGMPTDLHRLPLATALVELVLRFAKDRSWAWSTISSNLSCIASALRSLHMYSDVPRGLNLRTDDYFLEASKHAQTLARKSISETQLTPPMSPEVCDRLCRSVVGVPSTWLLAKLCWFFAARVGDMRQVRKNDVHFKEVAVNGVPISITFRYGKGAAFWGPYTIHSVVPENIAQPLRAFLHRAGEGAVFSGNDQSRLSLAVRNLKDDVNGINLRSFRRGSLMHLASLGVSDGDLMMLSGHKRPDTLLRYLNWGEFSASAAAAAANRAKLLAEAADRMDGDAEVFYESDDDDEFTELVAGAGETLPDELRFVKPSRMGLRSGFCGPKGRRIQGPVKVFPLAPPFHDLYHGTESKQEDPSLFPLHVKRVGLIDLEKVACMPASQELRDAQRRALHWLNSDEHYGIDWAPLAPTQVPLSKLSPEEVATLREFGKLTPHQGPIRSFAKCWLLPQPSKRVRRPIMEPFINDTMLRDLLPKLHMPSRLERRAQTVGAKFQAEFDFSAYYDQLEIPGPLRSCFVIRTKSVDGRDELWQLTRLPMGVRFAVAVAQYVTWTVTEPIAKFCSTCIDNVRITASTPEEFVMAVRTFVRRCDEIGATLNDRDSWNISDDELLNRGHTNWVGPVNFVGEEYRKETVANTEKCMLHLPAAFALVQDSRVTTRRRFAALIGLIIYMTHTVNIGLHNFFSLLRAYARLVSPSSPELLDVNWDEPITLVHSVVADVTQAVGLLTANTPVSIRPLLQPAKYSNAYDFVIIVDAAAPGWGAYVLTRRDIVKLQRGWNTTMIHSAHAEPKAATEALLWAKGNFGTKAHIAVVSDHSALADGQRRWWSGYGGFSPNHWLNTFYNHFYAGVDLNAVRRDVFFVEGARNPADGPSRSVAIKDPLSVTRVTDFIFPDVSAFFHPYMERPPRAYYEV